jgi:hypothetical protein
MKCQVSRFKLIAEASGAIKSRHKLHELTITHTLMAEARKREFYGEQRAKLEKFLCPKLEGTAWALDRIYPPQGELFGSFQLLRSFQSNKEQTEITHTSRYTFADGRTEEHAWQFNFRGGLGER